MTSSQFLVMLVLAAIVTALTVLIIPRERQSVLFDRLLWVATLVVSFLGAWLALLFANQSPEFQSLTAWTVLTVPLVPPLIGALLGALILNIPLWLMDRFSQPSLEAEMIEDFEEEEPEGVEPSDNGAEVVESQASRVNGE